MATAGRYGCCTGTEHGIPRQGISLSGSDPNGTEIREISGKNLDLDLDSDLDVDLDPDSRQPAAGSQTVQLQLLASKGLV